MRGFNPLIYVTLIIFEATDKDICFTTLISVPDFFYNLLWFQTESPSGGVYS